MLIHDSGARRPSAPLLYNSMGTFNVSLRPSRVHFCLLTRNLRGSQSPWLRVWSDFAFSGCFGLIIVSFVCLVCVVVEELIGCFTIFVSICAGSFGGLVGMLYLLVLLCMFSLIGICLFVNWF